MATQATTPNEDNKKDYLRETLEQALGKSLKPVFSDYLAGYRKRFDALSKSLYSRLAAMGREPTVARMGLADILPPPSVFRQLEEHRSRLPAYTQSIVPKYLQEQNDVIRKRIEALSKSIGNIVSYTSDPESLRVVNPVFKPYFPDLKPYLESAEAAEKALTPKPGSTTLSAQMAKAAIPKLVDFAEQLGNVTDVVITMKATTDTGATAEMRQQFKVESQAGRRQLLESMEITNATCNGAPVKIAVPKALNRHYGSEPIEIGSGRPGEMPQPKPRATVDPALGSHARRYVKEVDWEKRIIVFKGKSRNRVELPPDSDGAWNYMKRLLTSTAPKGWVELANNRDARWQGHFNRTDAHGNVDVKNPLTILLCHIESSRKRGRPSKKETEKAEFSNVPKIHLTPFQNSKFKDFRQKQLAAL